MEKAREVRRLHQEGAALPALAARFKLSKVSVWRVVHNLSYREAV